MLKLTLDTNCVIAAARGEPNAIHVDQLAELARAGRITISVTSGFKVDQRTARPDFQQVNLAYLATVPVIRVPGPFRLDMSFLDDDDVLVDDQTADLDKRIATIVLGGVAMVASKKMNDVHHLTAHCMAGNNVFVTSDGDDMVKKRDKLRAEVGIVVKTPAEAVALATSS